MKRQLISYIPKKYRPLISELYRERNFDGFVICCIMEWEDGFCRSLVCDSISELVWAVRNTANDRDFQF